MLPDIFCHALNLTFVLTWKLCHKKIWKLFDKQKGFFWGEENSPISTALTVSRTTCTHGCVWDIMFGTAYCVVRTSLSSSRMCMVCAVLSGS